MPVTTVFEGHACQCCAGVIANGDESGCRHYYGHTHRSALDGDTCFDCGGEVVIDENGVSNHLTPDGDIDFDADADHVALSDEQYADINGDLAGPHLDETAYRAS